MKKINPKFNNSDSDSYFAISNHGFSLLEVILAIAVFVAGIVSIGLFVINIQQSADEAQDLNQALLVASEGIEAVKAIRDDDFDTVDSADGSNGLELDAGVWAFNGEESDEVDLGAAGPYGKLFTRSVVIADSIESGITSTTTIKLIESVVSWESQNGTASTSLWTFLTNWER